MIVELLDDDGKIVEYELSDLLADFYAAQRKVNLFIGESRRKEDCTGCRLWGLCAHHGRDL